MQALCTAVSYRPWFFCSPFTETFTSSTRYFTALICPNADVSVRGVSLSCTYSARSLHSLRMHLIASIFPSLRKKVYHSFSLPAGEVHIFVSKINVKVYEEVKKKTCRSIESPGNIVYGHMWVISIKER